MEGSITLSSRVRIKEDVIFRDLEGESVMLDLKTGVYFGLDPLGTRIWQLLNEHVTLQGILESLLEEYEVTETECERDLLALMAQLHEKELIEVSD